MELGGDEKRIQALFSELSLEEQSRAQQFGHMWSRAQARESRAGSISRPVAVLISALVTAAACTVAIWTWYRLAPSPVPGIVNRLPQPEDNTPQAFSEPKQPVKIVSVSQRETTRRIQRKTFVRQRRADRRMAAYVALLSNWQSPTQRLLESPTSPVLSSLPQLNQSVKDLKSFLPKNNEVIKESNQ